VDVASNESITGAWVAHALAAARQKKATPLNLVFHPTFHMHNLPAVSSENRLDFNSSLS
jgi:hypothetical protein